MVVFARLVELFVAVVDLMEAVFKRQLQSEEGIFCIENISRSLLTSCYFLF